MAADAFYVSIQGTKQGPFKGESLVAAHRNQITGLDFSYEVSSPRDPQTGLPSGQRIQMPLVITKQIGAASPQIYEAMVTNEVLKNVVIQFVKTANNGAETTYYTITLTNATISDIKQHDTEAAATSVNVQPQKLMVEDVSFTFQKIEVSSAGGITAFDDWEARVE